MKIVIASIGSVVHLVETLGDLGAMQVKHSEVELPRRAEGGLCRQVSCVTWRDEIEWVELVAVGWNRLVPSKHLTDIIAAIRAAVVRRGVPVQPYGDGRSTKKIASLLLA